MAKVTVFGAAALAAAAADEEKIIFTTMLIGDGNGSVPNFTGAETSLVNQVSSIPVKAVYRRAANPNYIYIDAVIPWDDGGYTIREAAVADENGNIIIIGKYAPLPKPDETSDEARQVTVRLIAVVSNQQITAISLFSDDGSGGIVVSSGSGFPIGYVRSCPFAGDKFTDAAGHEWLLKGLLHTKAGYEKALEQKALRSYGQLVYPGGVNGMITQAATDGLGTTVIATSNTTHVLVVKNNGDTVTAVAHNLPGKAVGVIYVGGAFVVASNTATAINTSYSTDGGGSFSAASVARVLTSGTVDSVRGSSDGAIGMFVASGDVACVSFTSGTARTNRTLPLAVTGSYIPLIQAAAGVIIIGRKNTTSYLRTVDGGANFSTISSPVSSVVSQDMTYALGKFFWSGNSGSSYYLYSSVNGLDWVDVLPSVPEPFRSYYSSYGSYHLRVYGVSGGMVLGVQNANYFTTDFQAFELIKFSRSAEELGGSTAQYFCFRNLVFGGFSVNEAQGGSKSAMLKVDYSTPDYVGIHVHGASPIVDGMSDYVRIK